MAFSCSCLILYALCEGLSRVSVSQQPSSNTNSLRLFLLESSAFTVPSGILPVHLSPLHPAFDERISVSNEERPSVASRTHSGHSL